MSSDNFTSDIIKGATKGFLDWSSENIALLVKKFKEKKLAFIKDPQTIEIVKQEYRSGESKFYQKYVKNKEILFLVRIGLVLRKLENNETKLQNLRDKIFRRYKVRGLHIAEFVQAGILNRYLGLIIEDLSFVEELEKEIEEVLGNIEKHTLFVKYNENPFEIIKKVSNIVDSHTPRILIIFGIKSSIEIIRKAKEKIKQLMKNYELGEVSGKDKEILFFKRKLHKNN